MKSLMIRSLLAALISVFVFFLFTLPVSAADELIYDTSNHYLGTCDHTDTVTWTLTEDLPVSTFQVWYDWATSETSTTFTLTKDGASFQNGTLTRATCDPYQGNWCNGDLAVNKTFPKGSYVLKVPSRQICAIPSGNGTVRLYKEAQSTTDTTPATVNEADKKTDPSLTMIYDTSNRYIGACGLTDSSTWTSTEDMNVTVLQIWYSWESGETSVPFTFTKDGSVFATGVFTKTDECQWTWCNGNFTINKTFPKGSVYSLKVGKARQCKDDKGLGVVRLFGPSQETDITGTDTTNTDTASNTTDTVTQTQSNSCPKCNTTIPAAAGVGGLVLGAGAATILLRKR